MTHDDVKRRLKIKEERKKKDGLSDVDTNPHVKHILIKLGTSINYWMDPYKRNENRVG